MQAKAVHLLQEYILQHFISGDHTPKSLKGCEDTRQVRGEEVKVLGTTHAVLVLALKNKKTKLASNTVLLTVLYCINKVKILLDAQRILK